MQHTQAATLHQAWRWTAPSTTGWGRFLLHFAEMCIAMEAGMLVFHALPIGNPLRDFASQVLAPHSYSAVIHTDLDVHLLGMWIFMTVPMVLWMRIRGHGWRHGADMAGAMLVPTLLCIGLCWLGLDLIFPWLPASSMPAMLVAMLALMLLHRQHYTWSASGRTQDPARLVARDAATLLLGVVVVVATLFPLRPEFSASATTLAHAGYQAQLASDGVQEATVVVKGGYTPDLIIVQQSQPVRLNFVRDEASTCGAVVVFSDFGSRYYLPEGQVVPVELMPDRAGDFVFTCEMNHYRGHLIVQ